MVEIVPLKQRTYGQQEFKDYLRRKLRVSPAAIMSVQDYSPVAGGGNRVQPVQFNLRSTDPDALLAAVEKTRKAMLANPHFADVDTTWRTGKPQLDVVVDRERAAALGVPAALLGQNVRALMGGDKVTDFHEGGDTYEIKVKLPPAVLGDPGALGAVPVRAATGQLVELRTIADVRPSLGPSQIDRQAQMRQVTLLAELKNYGVGEAIKYLDAFAAKELPPTVVHDYEGQAREMGKMLKEFGMALLLGIVLVYIVLAAQFESLVHPFTIMLALPFSVIGGIGALALTGQYISILSMIG